LDNHPTNITSQWHLARWMEVDSGGQFLSSGWPHCPATRIRPT